MENGDIRLVLEFHIVRHQKLLQVSAGALPCLGVDVDADGVLADPGEEIGDKVGVLGQEQGRKHRAGLGGTDIGAAHSVDERSTVVADDTHDDAGRKKTDSGAANERRVLGLRGTRRGGTGRVIRVFRHREGASPDGPNFTSAPAAFARTLGRSRGHEIEHGLLRANPRRVYN